MNTKTFFLSVFLIISFLFACQLSTYGQSKYAHVSINGKAFTKKLKVEVDFGEEPDQIAKGEEYSAILNNKKSFASILNYMEENGYELVQSMEIIFMINGGGGTQGIQFIMREKQ